MSLLSFDANDPSFNLVKSSSGPICNKAGLFGAYASGFLNDIFGIGALLLPLILAALGAAYVSRRFSFHWWRWAGFSLLTICLLVGASSAGIVIGDLTGGGMVGNTLSHYGSQYLSPIGSGILWIFVFLIGIQLSANLSWSALLSGSFAWLAKKADKYLNAGAQSKIRIIFHESSLFFQKISDFFRTLRAKMPDIRLPLATEKTSSPVDETQIPGQEHVTEPVPEPASQYAFDDDPFAASQDLGSPANNYTETVEEKLPPDIDLQPVKPAFGKATQEEIPLPEKDSGLPASVSPHETKPETKKVAPQRNLKLFDENHPVPLPSTEILEKPEAPPSLSSAQMEENGRALMACFKDFDIQADLVAITPGPVVTMYQVRPAPGVRGNRIANLSDDLARVLKAVAVRIQAPIPGSDTVGIEVPNEKRETVNFRQLAECDAFRNGCGPLTMILGKDISGNPYMADLTEMPHLLVAGATGAGKSVCLNSILISFLYKMQPSQMRLLLIDPKRIEMAIYADLPHLAHPIVTEMDDAKNALDWAVHEMERRYKNMARLGARDIISFNNKLATFRNELPTDYADLEPFPYLVIVIDELADLMMTAARDVETSIVRLAQLARAAGIHMILATQRPSVNVVTGLIKVNFPCRVSFYVTSKYDSKTILDQAGAEHLLGKGDMLFKPKGGLMKRLHGPFLREEEVQAVVDYWKSKLPPSYQVDFSQWKADAASPGSGNSGKGDNSLDPLYEEARKFLLSQDRISISLLQRYLKIGYNRSARLMDQFEQEGLLGPSDGGSKPRAVIHN